MLWAYVLGFGVERLFKPLPAPSGSIPQYNPIHTEIIRNYYNKE